MWCHFIWCIITDILNGSRAKRLFDLKVKAAHSVLRIFGDHTSSVTVSHWPHVQCHSVTLTTRPVSQCHIPCSAKLRQEFQISSLFAVLFTVTVSILEYCLEVIPCFWCRHFINCKNEIAVAHWKWFLMFVMVLFIPL